MKLLILIPVLNEMQNISELLMLVQKNISGYHHKILFVDDGSTDGTLAYLQAQQKHNDNIWILSRQKQQSGCKRGKALIDGLIYATGKDTFDCIIEMDGNLSHNPKDISNGIALIKQGSDVVIASKYLPQSAIAKRSWVRNRISYLNSALFRLFLSDTITDYSNGYRFYNYNAAELLKQHHIKNEGPIYLGEVLGIWHKNRFTITEFASVYTARHTGESKVIVTDVLKSILATADILVRYHVTGFSKK